VFLARDLPHLPWRRVLGLDPAKWPPPVRRELEEAQALWRQVLRRVADDVSRLRAESSYDRLPDRERASFSRRLRLLPSLESSWGRCLLRCFPAGPTPPLVAKALRDLAALRGALEDRAGLDLDAVLAALRGSSAG
jgi:hypothetical protein